MRSDLIRDETEAEAEVEEKKAHKGREKSVH